MNGVPSARGGAHAQVVCGSTLACRAAGMSKGLDAKPVELAIKEMKSSEDWLPRVSLAELKERGYREDSASRGAFQAKFAHLTLPGLALVVAGVAIFSFGWAPFPLASANFLLPIVCFIVGMTLCLSARGYMLQSSAMSRQTRQPMERYLRADTMDSELVFVDHEGRTCFTYIFGVD